MKKNKKIFIIAIIFLILIIGGLLVYNFFIKNKLIELNVDEVIEKINNKESFVLCISQTECEHCNNFKPKLKKIVSEYKIDIFYIDINKYEQEDVNKFKKEITFDGNTPVTAFIINGEEPSASTRINGDVKYSKIIDKFKKFGFIEQ